LGESVAADGIPVQTTGATDVVTIKVQQASAQASSSATNAGLASFNSADFSVDANGYVTFTGSGATETLTGNSGGAVGPAAGNINTVGTGSITVVGNPGTNTTTVQLTGLTNHDVLVGAGTATITSVSPSTAGFVLTSNGVAADPSFQAVTASGAVTTVTGNSGGAEVPLAGNFNILGTGSITVAGSANTETVQLTGLTNHALQVGAGTATLTQLGAGTTGQVLQTNTGADPTWSSATYPSTTTINDVLYSSANNVVGQVTAANNGVFISGTTGVPSWLAAGTTGQVLTATTGSPATWASPATSGTVTSVSVVSANGFAGTVATATTTPAITLTTTQTGLLSGNGTAVTGTAITQYNVLTAGASNAPNSVAPSATSGVPLISQGAASQPVFGTSVVAGGGTAATSFNTTGVVISGATSTTALSAITLTDGQLAIGSSAGNPAAATLTAGTGVTITNGHNSITISSSSAGFTWNDVTTTPTTMAAENGYIADSSSFLQFVLPTNNSLGDTIKVVGKGTGLWTVITNGASSSYINFGSLSSTPSVGFLTSTNANDCIELVCTTASASSPIWTVVSSIGNIQVG
jgi:hypothetical protein